MIFRQYRIKAVQRRVAGLQARLMAVEALAKVADPIPGVLVAPLCEIPQEVAELQEWLKQAGVAQSIAGKT